MNSGAPAEAALHAGVPCLGGQGAALTPPPPGSPSRSLLLEAAGQVGGRGGLWGPLSPPQPRPSRVSGRGVGQTSGVRSQLLPPCVSSEQRTRLPGPRLPMRGAGLLPPARPAVADPGTPRGPRTGRLGLPRLPPSSPSSGPTCSLPVCGRRPLPVPGQRGAAGQAPARVQPPAFLTLLGAAARLISAAPPRGSLSPLSQGRERTKPFCAWLSAQRKCLGLVKKNVSIRTKSQVGTKK